MGMELAFPFAQFSQLRSFLRWVLLAATPALGPALSFQPPSRYWSHYEWRLSIFYSELFLASSCSCRSLQWSVSFTPALGVFVGRSEGGCGDSLSDLRAI